MVGSHEPLRSQVLVEFDIDLAGHKFTRTLMGINGTKQVEGALLAAIDQTAAGYAQYVGGRCRRKRPHWRPSLQHQSDIVQETQLALLGVVVKTNGSALSLRKLEVD